MTLLRTNVCSPLATNALAGNIWDNFSSQSYKQLPSVGTVTLNDPFTGEPMPYQMPAGGRGYTRVPSLISLWSTAPFLLNNTVGPFDCGSVGRSAHEGVRRLDRADALAARSASAIRCSATRCRASSIARRERSDVTIPVGYHSRGAAAAAGHAAPLVAVAGQRGRRHRARPDPEGHAGRAAGQPQAACRERRPRPTRLRTCGKLGELLVKLKVDLATAPAGASDERAARSASPNLKAPMLALSKCPDFVVNRGHYFGTAEFNQQDGLSADEKAFGREPELSDDDKRALIAFLKTF